MAAMLPDEGVKIATRQASLTFNRHAIDPAFTAKKQGIDRALTVN
jgi:hypothetical protein